MKKRRKKPIVNHAKLLLFRHKAQALTMKAETREGHWAAAAAHRKSAAMFRRAGDIEAADAHEYRARIHDEESDTFQ